MTSRTQLQSVLATLMAGTVLTVPQCVAARDDKQIALDLPAQGLDRSLRDLAAASGRTMLADAGVVAGHAAPAVHGSFTVSEALAMLLANTSLVSVEVGDAYAVRPSDQTGKRTSEQNEILVTGTRIRGAAPAGASVIAIDREAIEKSGRATMQDLMAALPQNFGGGPNESVGAFTQRNGASSNIGYGSSINLRGLGTTSTLTLLDGNRIALGSNATYLDTSLIPASAIERIEVLADGASAIYGSDAVAGVVNVRLRRNFEGAETSLRTGMADGFTEFQASQIFGKKWSTGHVMAAYEYYERGRLGAEDRTYATEDLRRYGGPDYRQSYANPGTIIAADGSAYGIPAGQDGRNLTPAQLIAGVHNLGDGRVGTDVLPRTRRHAGVVALEQEISPALTLRLQGFAADRKSENRYFSLNSPVSVPTANPFYVDPIGTGQPVTVMYDFKKDLGSPLDKSHVTNWAVSGSLEARLGAWRAEAYASHGVEHEQLRSDNLVNYATLAAALADSDPATAFNVFGDGSHTSATTIEKVRGWAITRGRSRQTTAGLKFDGPLFALPGGPLSLATGFEYRAEATGSTYIDDYYSLAPVTYGDNGYPLARKVYAAYGELRAPLIGPDQGIGGIRRFDLSVAARMEHYSDVGTTTNPKIGLTYEPVEGLALRGAYGTSFRAPSFSDTRQGPGYSQVAAIPVSDTLSPTGSSYVVGLFGNNPKIGPERARTLTAGVDVRPVGVPGLSLSATWFDVSYRDRIFNPGVDAFTFLAHRDRYSTLIFANPSPALVASYYADPTFYNPYNIPASAITYVIDGRNANLARSHLNGVDFDFGYHKPVGNGAVALGVSGTWLFHLTQQFTATAAKVEAIGTVGNPVRYRLRGRASFDRDGFGVAAFLNHTAGYSNTGVTPAEPVASWTTVDLTLSKSFGVEAGAMAGTRLALSVTNLFDLDPPYVNNRTPYSAAGFDPEQASAVGRLVAVQLVKSW
ncbi:MAG: hypothetical protein RIS94_1547 [Pseudomonadota bacterium]|jgi:outer membrane receptor protein involved in Fe transport